MASVDELSTRIAHYAYGGACALDLGGGLGMIRRLTRAVPERRRRRRAYVGCYTGYSEPRQLGWVGAATAGKGITEFYFDEDTGKLTPTGRVVEQDSPTWLEVDPTGWCWLTTATLERATGWLLVGRRSQLERAAGLQRRTIKLVKSGPVPEGGSHVVLPVSRSPQASFTVVCRVRDAAVACHVHTWLYVCIVAAVPRSTLTQVCSSSLRTNSRTTPASRWAWGICLPTPSGDQTPSMALTR